MEEDRRRAEDRRQRINIGKEKLSEWKFLEDLRKSNEVLKQQEKSSNKEETNKLLEVLKKRIREANMAASNKERAIGMKTDILQERIVTGKKRKDEIEQQLKDTLQKRDTLLQENRILSLKLEDNALCESRRQFTEAFVRSNELLYKYASIELLRNKLAQTCLEQNITVYKGSQKEAKTKECLLFVNKDVNDVKQTRNFDKPTENVLRSEISKLRAASSSKLGTYSKEENGSSNFPLDDMLLFESTTSRPIQNLRSQVESSNHDSLGLNLSERFDNDD